MLTFKIDMESPDKHIQDYFQDFLTPLQFYETLSCAALRTEDILIFFSKRSIIPVKSAHCMILFNTLRGL